MKHIIIRTNFSKEVGLGHIFRMKHLAKELSKKSKLTFYLDNYNELIEQILNFECQYLYKKNQKFQSQRIDSIKLKNEIKNKKIDCIIVDDYRLDAEWEKSFYTKIPIVVFDDYNFRKHKCDIIVDAKWTGKLTYKRYNGLVNKKTLKLCGPNFSIINSYKRKTKKSSIFKILFYIGGGGDFNKYLNFLFHFSEKIKKNKKYKIFVICGPLARGQKKLKDISKKNKNIVIIYNNLNISKILSETNLYVGVSSSIIYELNYLNVLSVLFASSANQKNDIMHLKDLGFNFLISDKDFFLRKEKVCDFLILLIKNYKKLKILSKKKLKIDNNGSKRISKIIFKLSNLTLKQNNKIENFLKTQRFTDESNNKKDGIYKVKDNQINNYLMGKNLSSNLKNSINTKKIKNLDHYIWWFTQKSKLFYYIRNKKIRIYLNHRKIFVNKNYYYYGGWFVAKNKIKIGDAIKIVKWQTTKFKKYPWLAIIKKKNKFVYKLNDYLKFKKINFNNVYKKFFNIKNQNQYYLLKK